MPNPELHFDHTEAEFHKGTPEPVRPSKWKTIAFGLLAIVLTIVGLLCPIPFGGRSSVAIGDMFHAPLFGGLALGTLLALQSFFPVTEIGAVVRRSACVFVCLFLFGVAMEITQNAFGRSGNIHDAVNNGLGILAAICAFAAWWSKRDRKFTRPSFGWLALAVLPLAIAWWTPFWTLHDVDSVRRNFPQLASFESKIELNRWYLSQSQTMVTRQGVTEGNYAMELTVEPTAAPRATLIELAPDWSKLATLELDVVVDEATADESIVLRVSIVERQRREGVNPNNFSKTWKLKPGQPQHLVIKREEITGIPKGLRPYFANIQYLDLTVVNPSEVTTLRIDDLKLTLTP